MCRDTKNKYYRELDNTEKETEHIQMKQMKEECEKDPYLRKEYIDNLRYNVISSAYMGYIDMAEYYMNELIQEAIKEFIFINDNKEAKERYFIKGE